VSSGANSQGLLKLQPCSFAPCCLSCQVLHQSAMLLLLLLLLFTCVTAVR
jgi:hypothetical protein